jgi:hypothetical protein
MKLWESKTYGIQLLAECKSDANVMMNNILMKLGHQVIGVGDIFLVEK